MVAFCYVLVTHLDVHRYSSIICCIIYQCHAAIHLNMFIWKHGSACEVYFSILWYFLIFKWKGVSKTSREHFDIF